MTAKRLIMILFVAIFSFTVTTSAAWAGSAQHHRLEGLALGIGALIIGKAILDAHRGDHHVEAHVGAYRYDRPVHRRPHRHWEIQRVWIPAKYEKVWNPGHYSRRGHWIPGHWRRIEIEPGYWTRQRVRVRH